MDIGIMRMDLFPQIQNDISTTTLRQKPAVPKKPVLFAQDCDARQTTHVKNMVRKLQEKESPNTNGFFLTKPNFQKLKVKPTKSAPVTETEEVEAQSSNQTLEDLKAIDEDIENLRKQIEERDKIISALREAAEVKDQKFDSLMMEYTKLRSSGKLDLDGSSEVNRVSSSSPSSPPLCNGELCWTDNFVNKNYHEPVYAQLLNDHSALQKTYNELRTKLESKTKELERLEAETQGTPEESKTENHENGINLVMVEQIRILKDREAQLMSEAEELKEQNDLLEFRILELEECRKEFADKEVKHRREKIVWPERDLEEVSDSGVMSLPTSEDLTSDSEIGEAIRNYSPVGAFPNLSLPLSPELGIPDVKFKKSLKTFECLQESGIFEDSDCTTESAITPSKLSKGCQTEFALDKTLLEFLNSSCNLLLSKSEGFAGQKLSDDLSTEISKLSVIQKCIQQKTVLPTLKGSYAVVTCPHSKSVLFYESRLTQLEDKLKIYESSEDTKDNLLAKRLEKEIQLAHKVQELTERIASLELTNQRLEEEKCEFEEAENDTRFQCQRLEIRLQELLDKNTELELELERQKIKMGEDKRRERRKESLENLLNKYEQRNFELEEKEIEARHRLSMIEAAMPAIVAWNVYQIANNSDFISLVSNSKTNQTCQSMALVPRLIQESEKGKETNQALEDLTENQKTFKAMPRESEKVVDSAVVPSESREKELISKIEELEKKAAKDREMLEEMTQALKTMKAEESYQSETATDVRPEEMELFEKLKHMVVNEIQLRAEITRLEQKEQAYMHSLEKADEIWASMEADYKKRLNEAEAFSQELQKRISHLETTQSQLKKALSDQPVTESILPKCKNDVKMKLEELIEDNEKLKDEITSSLNKKFDEHKKFLETENLSLKEELQMMKYNFLNEEKKFMLLQKELEIAKREALREKEMSEKWRWEAENQTKSVSTIETSLQNQISELTQELSQKSKELSNLEVTVAELREEVETLENKVGELVVVIQNLRANQEEEHLGLPSTVEQWSLPVSEPIHHVITRNLKNPMAAAKAEPTFAVKEILEKCEKVLAKTQRIFPPQQRYRRVVPAYSCFPRQEMKYLYPVPTRPKTILVKYPNFCPMIVLCVRTLKNSEDDRKREDEIFQLSLKNAELQQVLEKMEKESRLKENELVELQKIALKIRKEQQNLEQLYDMKAKEGSNNDRKFNESPSIVETNSSLTGSSSHEDLFREPRRKQSIDELQKINPIVVKAPTQVSESNSNLKIAFNEFGNKSKANNVATKSLLDELNQKDDIQDRETSKNDISRESSNSSGINLKEKGDEDVINETKEEKTLEMQTKKKTEKQRSSAPISLGRSSSATSSMLPSSANVRSTAEKPHPGNNSGFSYVAPIRKSKKIGDNALLLEWDITEKPNTVTGFEILVNGMSSHRMRSSIRNKAVLHSLDFNKNNLIQLFATSDKGRSTKFSHIIYPD